MLMALAAVSIVTSTVYAETDPDMFGRKPMNANELLEPSEEELNEIMMQEAQEAMQEYEQDEGYYDYDPSLGKRGR